MSRLIDEDKVYEDLANNLSFIIGDGSDGRAIDTYVTIGGIIHDTFSAQPTAYDVDKVVKQLEDLKSQVPVNRILDNITKDKPKELGQLIAYGKAIEIVKGGGIDA